MRFTIGYGVTLATISHQSINVRLMYLSYSSFVSPANNTAANANKKAVPTLQNLKNSAKKSTNIQLPTFECSNLSLPIKFRFNLFIVIFYSSSLAGVQSVGLLPRSSLAHSMVLLVPFPLNTYIIKLEGEAFVFQKKELVNTPFILVREVR